MPIPFSAKAKLSYEEAIEFGKYEVRIIYPMVGRFLIALAIGGWFAWISYVGELDPTLADVGIVLCALAPFALVWLYRLITLIRFRALKADLAESTVTIDSDGLEVAVADVIARWKWKQIHVIANTPIGLMFFAGRMLRPILCLPNRILNGTDKSEILGLALAGSVSVIQLA